MALLDSSVNPAWNLDTEYEGVGALSFKQDVELFKAGVMQLEKTAEQISAILKTGAFQEVEALQKFLLKRKEVSVIAYNLWTYLNCRLSVDVKDVEAKTTQSEMSSLYSRLEAASTAVNLYLMKTTVENIEAILSHPDVATQRFAIERNRMQSGFALSESEENLLVALERAGHDSWGRLYNSISGNMKCHIRWPAGTEVVGLSVAHSYLRSDKDETRRLAWEAIQESWRAQEESAAAILNNLADWRHELNKKRSHSKPVHFLDEALFGGRISQATLNSMIQVCEANKEKIQKANFAMARVMGKSELAPWDLLAECPLATDSGVAPSVDGNLKSFDEAMDIVIAAFSEVSSKMAEFAKMMKEKNWIEGRMLPNKRNGAYCTGFAKSRTPRVFMSFRGSNKDLMTLAHELGHAFHSWSMRDMPRELCGYPMTLAETASVFAETVVQNYLLKHAKNQEEKLEFAWIAAESASSFLLNIPARFDFEKSFYEQRLVREQSADELRQLTEQAWAKWYGRSLSKYDSMFWAHKLHFHMAGISFYNFPYTFGYLFSLAIYSKKDQLGVQFFDKYVSVLRDTGSMTAEDLIKKHFNEDIEKPEFWQMAVNIVLKQIEQLESVSQELIGDRAKNK